MTPSTGQPPKIRHLGDFEILREIGRGGMGVVYEARQVSLNRRVALKVMFGGPTLSAKAVQRFRREAEAAGKLHHSHIVPVYLTGEEDSVHFYAMEMIDGPSLDRVLRRLREPPVELMAHRDTAVHADVPPARNQLTASLTRTSPHEEAPVPAPRAMADLPASLTGSDYFEAVARMIADVADALEHAHQLGVIHRDIKPSNLLLAPDGKLCVNDFGLARLAEQPSVTGTGEFVGTPTYMSPEQITAGRTPLDHRTDIYSLGATLYELLTLQVPFTGERREQVLAQILHKEPKPPRRLNQKVPRDLETICLKAMEKDPDRRYQTAGQLADDLRRYLNRFAITAHRAGPVARLHKWVRRRPALAAVSVGVFALALVAGLCAYLAWSAHWHAIDERRQRALETAQLAALSGDVAGAKRAIADAESLGASPAEVHMLRGQLALNRGDHRVAIEHLEKAADLMPDRVAPRAMLGIVHLDSGNFDASLGRCLNEVERLTPQTAEDFLYLGQFVGALDPDRGLEFLDRAVTLRPGSVIALLARAKVLLNRAIDTANLDDLEAAKNDVTAAEAFQHQDKNLVILITRLHGCLVEVSVARHHQRKELEKAALEKAWKVYHELDSFPEQPNALLAQYQYLAMTDNLDELEALCESRKGQDSLALALAQAHLLYVKGDLKGACKVQQHLLKRFPNNMLLWVKLGWMQAEDTNLRSQARYSYQKAAGNDAPGLGVPLYAPTILLLLGEEKAAMEACRTLRRKAGPLPPGRRDWYEKLLDYNCGRISEDGLIQAAGQSQQNLCEAHCFIGLHRLARGDRAGARDHFQQSADTGVFTFLEYFWSRRLLNRLEHDPAWPSWIPPKKSK
jgi:serine/threonine protein kinase/predicted Zn-dependent protease